MSPPSLEQWQAQFKRYLFSGANEAQLAQAIADPTGIGEVTRMDIYRNAYYIRLQAALAHDFPVLLTALGDEDFGHQIANYLQACPSTSPSLRNLGQRLPGWFRKSDEQTLRDLAALEWAVLHAFDAAGASPLDADELVTISPEHWHQLRFNCILPCRYYKHRVMRTNSGPGTGINRQSRRSSRQHHTTWLYGEAQMAPPCEPCPNRGSCRSMG